MVATLWPVEDVATSLLLSRFYRLHLDDGLSPARALRQAQLWLRDATALELIEDVKAKRHAWAAIREKATEVFRGLVRREPDDRPYAHPLFWAAFQCTGT